MVDLNHRSLVHFISEYRHRSHTAWFILAAETYVPLTKTLFYASTVLIGSQKVAENIFGVTFTAVRSENVRYCETLAMWVMVISRDFFGGYIKYKMIEISLVPMQLYRSLMDSMLSGQPCRQHKSWKWPRSEAAPRTALCGTVTTSLGTQLLTVNHWDSDDVRSSQTSYRIALSLKKTHAFGLAKCLNLISISSEFIPMV